MEEWRDIEGYEGLYQVSNLGRVRSLDHLVNDGIREYIRKGRVRILTKASTGYYIVTIHNRKSKNCLVHRLVAQAFIPNPDNLPDINHKDEDKTNNTVDNLEWCDKQYNNNYGTRKQRADDAQHKKSVLQCDMNGNIIREFMGVAEAARSIGKPDDATSISKCCRGKLKYAHGYTWKFKEAT